MQLHNEFLITKKNNLQGFEIREAICNDYYLHVGPFLNISISENSKAKLIVIGNIYDYLTPSSTNLDIVNEMVAAPSDFKSVLEKSFRYSGNYLFIYCDKKKYSIRIVTDMAAQREAFYVTTGGDAIIGSNPKMMNSFFPQEKDESPEAVEFFNSPRFKSKLSFVTDTTNYATIKHLKPNHYFDFSENCPTRYFPNKKIVPGSINEVSKKGAKMIKGYMKAASLRKDLLIAVTAGWDSRLLLAASKELKNNATYFVLVGKKSALKKYDVQVPKKLFKKLGLPFVVGESYTELTEKEKIKIDNKFDFPKYELHKRITNFNAKYYSNHININGNVSEIARLEFDEVNNLTPKKIAHIEKYPYLEFALRRYAGWFKENSKLFKRHRYRVLDMLYWEENCANWVAKTKTEFGAYGIEKFSPFNSRELILTFLSVDKKYRRKQNPVLYKRMIDELWPEVLQAPINPGTKKIAMRITQKLGIFTLFRNLKLNYYLLKGIKMWQ